MEGPCALPFINFKKLKIMSIEKLPGQDQNFEGKYKVKEAFDVEISGLAENGPLGAIAKSVKSHLEAIEVHTGVGGLVSANGGVAIGLTGATAVSFVDAAVRLGDTVQWSVLYGGTGSRYGISASGKTGVIEFVFNAAPLGNEIISYAVFRI